MKEKLVKEKSLMLKVYKNRRNGQALVLIPKKQFKKGIPSEVKISW